MMTPLLTYAAAARIMSCSKSHVMNLAAAAERAGKPDDAVPPRLRRYLRAGFPRPIILGQSRRMARIDGEELEKWIQTRK